MILNINQDGFKCLQERVAFVLNALKDTYDVLSENLGVNRNTIMSYKKGKGDLKGIVVENLVLKYNINPNWLLLGRGPLHIKEGYDSEKTAKEKSNIKPLNSKLLEDVINGVENWLLERKLELDPASKAELELLLYEQFVSSDNKLDTGTLERFMRLGTK